MRFRLLFLLFPIISLVFINPISVHLGSGFTEILPQANITPISPVVLSTPNESGAIYHIVQYGQTLEMIATAYGITIAELRTLNNLAEGASDIYIGQSLIIKVSQPPTETPTLTPTTAPPTRTPRSITPIKTPTPFPTATKDPGSLLPSGFTIQRRTLGFILTGIGSIGLLLLGFYRWMIDKQKQS